MADVPGGALDARALLASTSASELLGLHEAVLDELRGRGVVRTSNGPWADYAELLVASHFTGSRLAPPSEKSADVVTADGRRIQVKARVLRRGSRGERELSALRSLDFDEMAVVLFQRGAEPVLRAALVPLHIVRASVRRRERTNAYLVVATDAFLAQSGVVDVTAELRRVQRQLDDEHGGTGRALSSW